MSESVREQSIIEKEQKFHDHWAETLNDRETLVYESFYYPTCPENKFILSKLGPLKGKKVLELGCGHGTASVFFALCGAEVTATDISPGMLQVVQKLASRHGIVVQVQQSSADSLAFPDQSFDIVYAANLLHHVDTCKCVSEVYRVLKCGGKAAFWDPIKYNPVIGLYRMMANQVRSLDEHPLGRKEIGFIRQRFNKLHIRFFWLSTLLIFAKYYFWDGIHPNEERYWKKVVYDYAQIARLHSALVRIDNFLFKLPVIRWFAWNVGIVAEK